MDTMRLFWAINLPRSIQEELLKMIKELDNSCAGVRWVKQENLHLTVKFLGECPARSVQEMLGAVGEAVASLGPFKLELGGVGTFGRPARVIWLGVGGDVATLQELRSRLESSLARLGYPADARGFKPHLTLGRIREGLEIRLPHRIPAATAPLAFSVRSLDLMQSVLRPGGPSYTVLGRTALSEIKSQRRYDA